MDKSGRVGRAEEAFRAAFERLKEGRPKLLGRGAAVSQNNVAKEAGVDPSALKKSRFPSLIAEIQAWVAEHGEQEQSKSKRQTVLGKRSASRTLKARLADAEAQRDKALSALVDADAEVLALYVEVERLRSLVPATNVTLLRGAGSK